MPTQLHVEKDAPAEAVKKLIELAAKFSSRPNRPIRKVSIDTTAGAQHYLYEGERTVPEFEADASYATVLKWVSDNSYAMLESITVDPTDPKAGISNLKLSRKATHDTIVIGHDGNRNHVVEIAALLDIAHKDYSIVPKERLDNQAVNSDPRTRDEATAFLVRKFADAAAELNLAITTGVRTVLEEVTAAGVRLNAEADTERKRLRAEFDIQDAGLRVKQEAFECEKKAFNDKASTLVRRDLLDKIRIELKDHGRTFKLSNETYRRRWPVMVAFYFLGGLSLVGVCAFGHHTLGDATPPWRYLVPFSLSVATFVSTAIFYIKWHSVWVARHADLETRNQLFNYDMLRASWFAEMLFEYKDSRDQGLPESVIEVMTKNLFSDLGTRPLPSHPADALIGLLGRVRRVRLSDDEIEIEGQGVKSRRKTDS